MSLSSSDSLDWHHCNFPWYFDWRHFPPKVYGRGRFDLPHKQQDYILRPRESIRWISPCLINLAQRPIEDITCMLFGYLALNEQPLLARLRPAGGTERIVVIAESTKQFVLCKNILLCFPIERGARQVSRPSFTVEIPMLSLVTALVSIGNILQYWRHMH